MLVGRREWASGVGDRIMVKTLLGALVVGVLAAALGSRHGHPVVAGVAAFACWLVLFWDWDRDDWRRMGW